MASGCAGVTCADEADFAALINVVDFCGGLYNQESDDQQWQPDGPEDHEGLLESVLQPARSARNAFAHNARLAFDSEEEVKEHIGALQRLLDVLPLAPGGRVRGGTLQALKLMAELSDGAGGGAGDEAEFGQVHHIGSELEPHVQPVLAYMRGVCHYETAACSDVLEDKDIKEATAPVPRKLMSSLLVDDVDAAAPAATGGGGGGGGGGAGGGAGAVAVRLCSRDLGRFRSRTESGRSSGWDSNALHTSLSSFDGNGEIMTQEQRDALHETQLRLAAVQGALARVNAWAKAASRYDTIAGEIFFARVSHW